MESPTIRYDCVEYFVPGRGHVILILPQDPVSRKWYLSVYNPAGAENYRRSLTAEEIFKYSHIKDERTTIVTVDKNSLEKNLT